MAKKSRQIPKPGEAGKTFHSAHFRFFFRCALWQSGTPFYQFGIRFLIEILRFQSTLFLFDSIRALLFLLLKI